MRITPAQAYGHPDFVTDVPVQGPTDPGIRAADCWWTQNVLPVKKPACADCNGPVPLWAKNPTAWGGGPSEYGGDGGGSCSPSPVRYGSRIVAGFALDAAGDPAATVTSDQQAWVVATLGNLNTQIGQATGTACASWQDAGTNLAAAVGCFQGWYNANSGGSLRTDGVLDQDTLGALQATATAHAADFQTSFPTGSTQVTPAAPAAPAVPTTPAVPDTPPLKKHHDGWSKNGKIAAGIAGAIAVAGIVSTAVVSKGRKK
jgi:hypothetical protein